MFWTLLSAFESYLDYIQASLVDLDSSRIQIGSVFFSVLLVVVVWWIQHANYCSICISSCVYNDQLQIFDRGEPATELTLKVKRPQHSRLRTLWIAAHQLIWSSSPSVIPRTMGDKWNGIPQPYCTTNAATGAYHLPLMYRDIAVRFIITTQDRYSNSGSGTIWKLC